MASIIEIVLSSGEEKRIKRLQEVLEKYGLKVKDYI